MAPKFQLYYFDLAGRAEVVRQVFQLANVEFEDTRITRMHEGDEWFKYWKSKAPFGQVPYLEIDEGDGSDKMVLCETLNIARYLARRFGLNGDSLLEQAKVEMIADCVKDYIEEACRSLHDPMAEEEKRQKTKWLLEEHVPATYANFERHLIMNNNGQGYFVGNDITWCDVYFTYRVLWMIHREKHTTPLNQFPKLKALIERVQYHPRCREWFKKYPFLPKSK